MLQKTQPADKFKQIDQMLEDFAGDEMDSYADGYQSYEKHHKHYSAEEDVLMDIDDLY
ncbi:MAG TPA: hypothetical protein VGE17_04440 [Methylophilus sp.]